MLTPHPSLVRRRLFEIIFEADTPSGRAFDLVLLAAILASVAVILVKSVPGIAGDTDGVLVGLEWVFTLLFTLEYLVRLWVVARPRKYAVSFFGVVDLLAVLPTYLSLFLPGAQVLLVIRMVRLIRVFHVLNLGGYEGAAENLVAGLRGTRFPLTVFLTALVVIVVFLGSLMYLVEGPDSGFTSIPVGIYWAAVTLTTLGYGDLVPITPLGRGITTVIVALSYWVLAVPVAIVSVELSRATTNPRKEDGRDSPGSAVSACPSCGAEDHQPDALHCRLCGGPLASPEPSPGSPPQPTPKPPAGPSTPDR